MNQVPEGLKYTREHEWVRLEDGVATVGISDYAQQSLGDLVYVELPKAGAQAKFMSTLGSVESVKAVSDLYSPLSGKVLEVNPALSDKPELVNQDPYGKGWMFKLAPSDPAEIGKLLDAKGYQELLAGLGDGGTH